MLLRNFVPTDYCHLYDPFLVHYDNSDPFCCWFLSAGISLFSRHRSSCFL